MKKTDLSKRKRRSRKTWIEEEAEFDAMMDRHIAARNAEDRARAFLINAAPDLLYFAKIALHNLERNTDRGRTIKWLKAVIAKAEGRT